MPVASANRPVVLAAVIMAAVVVCYCRVLWAGWIWDDDFYVWNNPTLHSLAGLRDIWLVPKATPQYYPLVHTFKSTADQDDTLSNSKFAHPGLGQGLTTRAHQQSWP